MEKEKQNKLISIIFGVVILAVAAIAAINLTNKVHPEVSVNGQILRVGMTVQELIDAGFSVGISTTGKGNLNLDVQPQIPGEKYSSTPYYIFKDGEYTNANFRVYNKNVNSCDFKDSRIYSFSFTSRFNFNNTEVLVNGINVSEMKKEEAILAFEKLGVKFDKDDREKFLNGDSSFIIGKSGDYSFELKADDANEVIQDITAKKRV